MYRNLVPGSLVLLLLSQLAIAGSMKEVAEAIPGDVVAALMVRNLKESDADYRMTLEKLGLKDVVPPDELEPLARLKEKLPGLKAFDESGSLGFVVLKSKNLPELVNQVAVLLPATDPARFLEDLGGDAVGAEDDRVRAVLLFGKTMYATATAKHVALSKTPEVCRQIRRQKATVLGRMSTHEVSSLDGLDAAIWIDASAVLGIFKPQIDGLISWALMMQMGSGEVGEEEARATKKQADLVIEGLASVLLGFALHEDGLGLRVTSTTKPGSELARQSQFVTADKPLLRGLPRRNYLVVFGQELHPAYIRAAVTGGIDPVLADLRKEIPTEKQKIDEIQKEIARASEMIRAVRGSIEYLDGSQGMIAASLVIETSDSREWVELVTRTINAFAALMAATPDHTDDDSDAPPLRWMPVESVEGQTVSKLAINLFDSGEVDDQDLEEAKFFLGPELLTFRIAAVDEKTVAITFGGGAELLARLVRSIRRDQCPLQEETGIALTAKNLPSQSGGVAYVAVDRLVNFFQMLSAELEDPEPFPIWLPRVDAPLGMTASGGDGWGRYDVFLPMPLLRAVVEAVQEMEFDQEEEEETSDEDAAEDGADDENPEDD